MVSTVLGDGGCTCPEAPALQPLRRRRCHRLQRLPPGLPVGFPDLALFHANSNRFANTIPSGIAGLPFIFELDVSNNLLSGSFPTAVLGPADQLPRDQYNAFSRAVPGELFTTFPVINLLFINNNQSTQALPKTIGNLKAT